MSVDLPTWTAFDPDALPDLPGTPPGRVVALLASAGASAGGWATSLAVGLAGAWSREGRRVVLADLGLARPSLHAELGESNAEGLTDALTFGASLARVARQVHGEEYFLVSAGTVVADTEATLSSPRWGKLCEGFRDAGVLLAAFIPADEPGRRIASGWATDVVVLADEAENVAPLLDGVDAPVLCVLGPAAPEAAPSAEVDLEGAQDGSWTEGGPTGPAGADAPAAAPDTATRSIPAPAFSGKSSSRSTSRTTGLLLLLLVIVVGALLAAWLGYIRIPGITHARGEAMGPAVEVVPVRHAPAPPTSSVQGYSVAVAAYGDSPSAAALVRSLERSGPGALVTAVPVEIDGALVYRVLLGPASSAAEASAMAKRVAARIGANASTWLVRPTPLAFELGEMDDLQAANRRVEELRGLDVSAYLLAVDFADGATRYRVYAGAFADQDEASWLEAHLVSMGLSDTTLSDRIGRLPE